MPNIFNNILWESAIILLLGGGIYFTIKLKGVQFRFLSMLKSFKPEENDKVTPFESLTMALAARIGVGSLAGIALAIYIGGKGTIFWIWLSSILTSVNAFSESLLGIKYHEKDGANYVGGPAYYIDKGLKKKNLARFYAFLIIFAYIVGFMSIQANTIASSLKNYYQVEPLLTGIIIAIISGYIIIKGLKQILNVTSFLVPIMGIGYLTLSIIVIAINYQQIPGILFSIIKDAFNFKALTTGFFTTFVIGIQRGVFSTEAGLGSGAIASSTVPTNNGVKIGLTQVLGIYFTSFVICTATALIILTSPYETLNLTDINGIEITQYALNHHLGKVGIIILVLSIISFAFSTIIAGYYYGESNLKYLKHNLSTLNLLLLKIITIIILVIGSIISSSLLWSLVDILVAIMAIINMYAILALRKDVVKEYQNYKKRTKHAIIKNR